MRVQLLQLERHGSLELKGPRVNGHFLLLPTSTGGTFLIMSRILLAKRCDLVKDVGLHLWPFPYHVVAVCI